MHVCIIYPFIFLDDFFHAHFDMSFESESMGAWEMFSHKWATWMNYYYYYYMRCWDGVLHMWAQLINFFEILMDLDNLPNILLSSS